MKVLDVFLRKNADNTLHVGQLAQKDSSVFFEYDADFLRDPLWLSPFKLPPESGIKEHREINFGPLFGLFDDSLPDGWGLLLMDKFFRKQNIDPAGISVLDRLAFLGKDTIGALTYEPAVPRSPLNERFDLINIAQQSSSILSGKTDIVLPQLMRAGGSPGGARPKVLVGVMGNELVSGETDLPGGFEHWIIKFSALNDFKDSGPLEYAYSLMAKDAGISMPETKLFQAGSNIFFGAKRFDRKGNHRFHVHTFGNLIHSNFRVPCNDYADLFKIIHVLTRDSRDVLAGFRMMIFNILAHNRDDHVKNFSFIMDDDGAWHLSPAYDLTYSPGPGGEHSMTILGEGKTPGKDEIFKIGGQAGLTAKNIKSALEQVCESVNSWEKFAQKAGVTSKTQEFIASAISKNLFRIKNP